MTIKNISKTILFASLITVMILPLSGMDFAEAEKLPDDKSLIKEKIKDKMEEQAKKDKIEKIRTQKYSSDEYGIPYKLIFEDNGKLVVGIDAVKATEFNERYSKTDVKSDLNTDIDLEVRYFEFEREANIRSGDSLVANKEATVTVVKNNKIITTGHAYVLNDIIAAGVTGTTTACNEVRITKDNNYSGAYADASYGVDTYNSQCGNTYVNDSIHFNGRNYAVTYGMSSDITLNKFIRIAGFHTTSNGYILDTDVTIRDPDGILNDQVIGSYSSSEGDSGAPIFTLTGSSSAKLLGQHVGRSCEVDLNSGTNFAYWCDANGNGGLKYFSPWDQVATHFGI